MPCLKLIKPKNARYHNGYKATQMSMRPVYRTFSPMGLALQKGWAQILAKSCCVFYLKGDVFKKHKSQRFIISGKLLNIYLVFGNILNLLVQNFIFWGKCSLL